LHLLGVIEISRGNLAVAGSLLEECLSLVRQLDAKQLMAATFYDLGVLSRCLGNLERATALQDASRLAYGDLNEKQGEAYALVELGIIAVLGGDLSRGGSLLKKSLAMFRDLGDQAGIAKALEGLAAAEVKQQPYRAAALIGAAEAIRQSIGAARELHERQEHETLVVLLKQSLGDSRYAEATADGTSRSLDETLSAGIEDEEPSLVSSSVTQSAPSRRVTVEPQKPPPSKF
jgi:hypothetical protein